MRRLVLVVIFLVAAFLLATTLAIAGAGQSFLMDHDPMQGSFVTYSGEEEPPAEVNMCRTTDIHPYWECLRGATEWNFVMSGTYTTSLDSRVYYWGNDVLPTYTATIAAAQFGWTVIVDGFYWTKPPITHTIVLTQIDGLTVYEYVGNSFDQFPAGLHYCRTLEADPWYECGYHADADWYNNRFFVPQDWYLIGSGLYSGDGTVISYSTHESAGKLGWSTFGDPEEGFYYEEPPEEILSFFIPIIRN